jgi:carboxymethylenebutenolidase
VGCGRSVERVDGARNASSSVLDAEEVRIESDGFALRGWLFKPIEGGPFPAVVYNHGSGRDISVDSFDDLAHWFRTQGFAILFPIRRGSTGSEGPYWQDEVERNGGNDRAAATIAQLEKENADVVHSVEWLRSRPFVNPERVSVAGCSFGGIHTLLTAEKPLGLAAAVDFAGAAMAWSSWSGHSLHDRLVRAVDGAQVPIFFAQAQNDFDTSPSRVLSAEMEKVGKPYQMKIFPPHGQTHMDGHAGFCLHGMAEWGPEVIEFLRSPPTARPLRDRGAQ